MSQSEATRLRLDDEEFGDDLTRDHKPAPSGSPCLVLKTATQTTYPTTANAYYHCEIVSVTGTETEGGTATNTSSGKTLKAYNYGSGIPPAGSHVVACSVPYGVVFRYP
jgi:hypothetical protein